MLSCVHRPRKPPVKPSASGKGKGVPQDPKPSPAVVSATPSAAVPSKASATPSQQTSIDGVIHVDDDDEETLAVVMARKNRAASGKEHAVEKKVEASAKDATANPESSKQQVEEEQSAFDKLVMEDRERSYAALAVLQEEIWPEDDREFEHLDRQQKKMNKFFNAHKQLRKVSNFFVTHVALERQDGTRIRSILVLPE